ncbi:MAG: glycosyltransferase [Gammaproteobacteria bacterium]|nr:glycosyltransferase [Gammaproteobacteria bacterium]
MKISVCIATYCRPERLALLLDDLVKQQRRPDEVVIIDNDESGSAQSVVELRREMGTPFPIRYDIQPIKNISLTRNRTVALASYDWIAFVDDDERAPAPWLKELEENVIACRADGALGPVVPIVPINAPEWIQRGQFYDWARMKTGTAIPPNKLRFGNLLLRGSLLRGTSEPFDPRFGLTGGEDGDLLMRLVQQGAHLVWCDEAIVFEPVEARRLSLRWLLLRSLRGGQDFARHKLNGRLGEISVVGQLGMFLRAFAQLIAALALMVFYLPLGRHRAAYWLLKAAANLGKMSIFLGLHYQEYGEKAT